MKFGVCTDWENAGAARDAGWDYVEESAQKFLRGLVADDQWDGDAIQNKLPLKIRSCNLMVPASLKITGPRADLEKLREYMTRVLSRAGRVGIKVLVFGSAGARQIPEGFDRETARKQIVEFASMAARIAEKHEVTIVAEPLYRKESNVINTVREGTEYVKAVDHLNFRCLVDSYHFWLEDERLEDLRECMPYIAHVHLADKDGRVPPGESGKSDYRTFFRVLKEGAYQGMISVEAFPFDLKLQGKRVLEFIKKQWSEC